MVRANEDEYGRSVVTDVVGPPAVGGRLPRPLLDDGRGAPGSASSAGEGRNDWPPPPSAVGDGCWWCCCWRYDVMPWHATQRYTDRHDYRPTSDTTTVRHPSDPNHHTTTSGKGPDQDLLRRTPLPNNSVLVRLHLTSCSPFHISFSLFSSSIQ